MSILFDQIVFGPVKSRRFGNSLGINLLPLDNKICNFNCVYCECGWTDLKNKTVQFLSEDDILVAAEHRFKDIATSREHIDHITFAGNGEPTMHPRFHSIVQTIAALRDQYLPGVTIVLLSNGSLIGKKTVRQGIRYVDQLILKLDAGTDEMLKRIDLPLGEKKISRYIQQIQQLDRPVIIQTLFLRGKHKQQILDNTTATEIQHWLSALKTIQPAEVMIYTIDREPPLKSLVKLKEDELFQISQRVQQEGINAKVYY